MFTSADKKAQVQQDGTPAALQALNTQLAFAHRAACRFGSALSNREKAISDLRMRTEGPGAVDAYAALFVVDAVAALQKRHGSEISDALLNEFGREQIETIVPHGKLFRWSLKAVLALWESEELPYRRVESLIHEKLRLPYEYKASVGCRIATFNIPVRTLILPLEAGTDIVPELDHFVEIGADGIQR
jgi:hypothetical protein